MKTHVIRLLPGQGLKEKIIAFIRQQQIEAGWIVTCVGSLTQTHLRFANREEGVKATGYFEIVSLTGTLSVNGSHLHLAASDGAGKTTGGQLLDENLVYTTAEIVIGVDDEMIFTRAKDESTGWMELQVERKGQ